MDTHRFIPRLDPLESRETPATGLSPEQVLYMESLANIFYTGTQAALTDQTFIRQAGNRAGTKALAGVIVQEAPLIEDALGRYVVELQERAAADPPVYAEWWGEQISRFQTAQARAHQAGPQAQTVSNLIDQFNAADAARAAGTSGTGNGTGTSNGTISTGVTGVNPFGVNTGVAPTTGTGTGTGTRTTTPTDTGTTSGTGTTTGTGTGTGTGAGSTTGSSPTGTTPTQSSGVSSGTPDSGTGTI